MDDKGKQIKPEIEPQIKLQQKPETKPAPGADVKTFATDVSKATAGDGGASVKTYIADMTKAVETNQGAVVKKMIEEQEQYEESQKNISPQSTRNKLFIVGTVIFIIAAITAVIIVWQRHQAENTVTVAPQYKSLIFTEHAEPAEIGGLAKDDIEQKIFTAANTTAVKPGGVEGIYPTVNSAIIGLRQFMTLIQSSFALDRLPFVADSFLTGAVKNKTADPQTPGGDFFLLLNARSFVDIFDGMHAWEPKMFLDLHGFFGIPITEDNKYLLTKEFEDGVIQNKNARILYDTAGKVVFMYVFADDTSVLVTGTESATREVILRLASAEIKK